MIILRDDGRRHPPLNPPMYHPLLWHWYTPSLIVNLPAMAVSVTKVTGVSILKSMKTGSPPACNSVLWLLPIHPRDLENIQPQLGISYPSGYHQGNERTWTCPAHKLHSRTWPAEAPGMKRRKMTEIKLRWMSHTCPIQGQQQYHRKDYKSRQVQPSPAILLQCVYWRCMLF